MKIENFALELNSQQTKEKKTVTTFESELELLNTQDSQKIDITGNELEFCKRLQYEMIQQFIFSLSSCSQQSTSFKAKEMNLDDLDRGFTTREVSLKQEYHETQTLDIQMFGCVQTATQKIDINMDISFSSSFVKKNQLLKTQFYDPLVLSFDGVLPDLDTQNFSFDIDCDGENDQLSMLKQGSGFLALDKNNNGVIDDGTELFGAQNGHGFYDLRRYDSDKNGWIDENDPIMDGLRIWMKNDKEDKLVALGELGIGALYLGFSKNSFDIKSEENETLGKIRSSGLFLNEDGTSGVMSQIDFARRVKDEAKNSKDSALSEMLKIS